MIRHRSFFQSRERVHTRYVARERENARNREKVLITSTASILSVRGESRAGENMQTGNEMLAIAKAIAIKRGPRTSHDEKLIGYYLTNEEIKKVFASEGYYVSLDGKVRARETWRNLVERWSYCDKVIHNGQCIYFILNQDLEFDYSAAQQLLIAQHDHPSAEAIM